MAVETKAELQTLLTDIRYGEKNYYKKCLILRSSINPLTGIKVLQVPLFIT